MTLKIDKERDINILMEKSKRYFSDFGVDEIKKFELTTIVSELGYNILKYAKSGTLEITIEKNIITIIATDKGEGFKDITNATKEGYSSSGTLGLGLGAIIRLSDEFDIQTSKNGTIVTVKKGVV